MLSEKPGEFPVTFGVYILFLGGVLFFLSMSGSDFSIEQLGTVKLRNYLEYLDVFLEKT